MLNPVFRVLGVIVLIGALGAPALAQDSQSRPGEVSALADRLDRLERELQDLQRTTYGGAQPSQPVEIDPNTPAAARLSVRIDYLERQMATLTGQVEELQFQLRQTSDLIARLSKSTEVRLQALETGAGLEAGGAPLPGSQAGQSSEPQGQAGRRLNFGAGQDAPSGEQQGAPAPGTPGSAPSTPSGPGQPGTLGEVPVNFTTGNESLDFDRARSVLLKGDFPAAEQAFTAFIEAYPNSDKLGEAHYWIGESLFVRELYTDAARSYLTVAKDYPRSDKAPESLIKLGRALNARGDKTQACGALRQLDKSFPDAPDRIKRQARNDRAEYGC